jgi:hypothetical protein
MARMSSQLQTALREEVSLVDKVQQLETDKAALEERVKQLAREGGAGAGVELEESKEEVFRLRQAVEEHKAAITAVRE